ncbi:MAG: tetratricopeptide repeat protein, partial [Pseudomonadota bacterium]
MTRRNRGQSLRRHCLALAVAAVLASGCGDRSHDTPAERQPDTEALSFLIQLQNLSNAGRGAQALQRARAYLETSPDTPQLRYAIGTLLATMDDFEAAIPFFEAEIELNPGHFLSHLGLALSLNQLGRPDDALEALSGALAISPSDGQALALNRDLLMETGELDAALVVSEQLLETSQDPDDWSEHGVILRQFSQNNDAMDAFERALELDARHSASLLNLGQLLVRSGETDRGEAMLAKQQVVSELNDRIDHLRRSSRVAGATPQNFSALGAALVQAGDMVDAERQFRRALQDDGRYPPAVFGLISILLSSGRAEEATQWSATAVMAAPQDFRSFYLLGMTRLKKGQFEEAEAAFAQSRTLQIWDKEPHFQIAEAYLDAGAWTRAAESIDALFLIDSEDDRLELLRDRLAAGQATEN